MGRKEEPAFTDFALKTSSWDCGFGIAFAANIELSPARRKHHRWMVQTMQVLLHHNWWMEDEEGGKPSPLILHLQKDANEAGSPPWCAMGWKAVLELHA